MGAERLNFKEESYNNKEIEERPFDLDETDNGDKIDPIIAKTERGKLELGIKRSKI